MVKSVVLFGNFLIGLLKLEMVDFRRFFKKKDLCPLGVIEIIFDIKSRNP